MGRPLRLVAVALGIVLVAVVAAAAAWARDPGASAAPRPVAGSASEATTRQPSPQVAAAGRGLSRTAPSAAPAQRPLSPQQSLSVQPATASITIPAAGVRDLRTVLYPGAPDDVRGTGFEEQGLAAVPTGMSGGVLPGQVGNLIVTAHRTAAGGPFRHLPGLHDGDHILVSWAGHTYDYVVVDRFWVTFHDPASYALQVAAVPGHPGATPTKAMVTLSTCATPEDNALGLHERDALGNPPHRIDVIGVLVAVR